MAAPFEITDEVIARENAAVRAWLDED